MNLILQLAVQRDDQVIQQYVGQRDSSLQWNKLTSFCGTDSVMSSQRLYEGSSTSVNILYLFQSYPELVSGQGPFLGLVGRCEQVQEAEAALAQAAGDGAERRRGRTLHRRRRRRQVPEELLLNRRLQNVCVFITPGLSLQHAVEFMTENNVQKYRKRFKQIFVASLRQRMRDVNSVGISCLGASVQRVSCEIFVGVKKFAYFSKISSAQGCVHSALDIERKSTVPRQLH